MHCVETESKALNLVFAAATRASYMIEPSKSLEQNRRLDNSYFKVRLFLRYSWRVSIRRRD